MYRSAKLFLSLLLASGCISCGNPEDGNPGEVTPQAAPGTMNQYLDPDWIPAATGPWGNLEYRRYFLPLPKAWGKESTRTDPVTWQVSQLSAAKLNELIAAGPLTELEKALWKNTCKVEDKDGGAVIHPSNEFRWSLLPRSRSMLYNWLASFPENAIPNRSFQYPAASQQEWLQNSGLRTELTQGISHFLYSAGATVRFTDLDLLEEYLTSAQERKDLLAVLHRQPYCELRLRLDKTSDLDKLAAYWGEWDRVELVRQLFRKTLGNHKHAYLSLAEVLPGMPRSLLNTFPALSNDTTVPKPNCSWTAFNFFNRTPDQRFCEAGFVMDTVRNYHDEVKGPWHYGDILLMTDETGQPVHAAVFLADDFVFTKNGGHLTKPWVIMKLADMKAISPASASRIAGYRWNPEKYQHQYHLSSTDQK